MAIWLKRVRRWVSFCVGVAAFAGLVAGMVWLATLALTHVWWGLFRGFVQLGPWLMGLPL